MATVVNILVTDIYSVYNGKQLRARLIINDGYLDQHILKITPKLSSVISCNGYALITKSIDLENSSVELDLHISQSNGIDRVDRLYLKLNEVTGLYL